MSQASVFSSSANEELHALRDLEGVPGLLDGPHNCQQFTVLSTANNLTCFEDPSLWLVIIDHEYVELLINVRPVVIEDEDDAKLTLVVHLEQMVCVSDVEHHRTHHMVFVLGLHMVGGLLNNRSNVLLNDLVECIGLEWLHLLR